MNKLIRRGNNMDFNELLSLAQKGMCSPRRSSEIRDTVWLTIDNRKIPIHEMSDKNLLGSIKGVFITLPARFIIEWEDTVKHMNTLPDSEPTEEHKLATYRAWLRAQWSAHIPDAAISMVEEADDRELTIKLGESAYAKETEKFIKTFYALDLIEEVKE